MIECFRVDESALINGKYVIVPIHQNFRLKRATGSFNIICARLFNLSYPNYLRMCRDVYGAEIIGKKSMYPVAYFTDKVKMGQLVDELNKRANIVLESESKWN